MNQMYERNERVRGNDVEDKEEMENEREMLEVLIAPKLVHHSATFQNWDRDRRN